MSKKMLFPVTYGIPEKHEGLVSYHICDNGIFRTKRVAGRGTITVKVDGIPATGVGKESINVLPRKIPIDYFWKIRDFFRYVEKTFNNESLEAYCLIGYNYDKDDFCLYVPKHTVSIASVNYDIESFWKDNPGYYLIMDIHSHGSKLSGYFSGTDDKDDNRERFSMVMGKINKIIPEVKLRFSSLGFYDFELDDVFTAEVTDSPIFDMAKSIKQIKLVESTITKGDGVTVSYSGYRAPFGRSSLYESIRYKSKSGNSLRDIMGEGE